MEHGLQCLSLCTVSPSKILQQVFHSVVDARRKGDENPSSGVVAETMKFFGSSSYGYQIIGKLRHTTTKHLNDAKTHKAINEPLFKRLNTVQKNLYEIKLLKSTIEHKKPTIV